MFREAACKAQDCGHCAKVEAGRNLHPFLSQHCSEMANVDTAGCTTKRPLHSLSSLWFHVPARCVAFPKAGAVLRRTELHSHRNSQVVCGLSRGQTQWHPRTYWCATTKGQAHWRSREVPKSVIQGPCRDQQTRCPGRGKHLFSSGKREQMSKCFLSQQRLSETSGGPARPPGNGDERCAVHCVTEAGETAALNLSPLSQQPVVPHLRSIASTFHQCCIT